MRPKRSRQSKQKNPVVVQDNENDALSRIAQPNSPINHNNSTVHSVSRFEGPLPHPDIFKRYSETIPDAPERILKQFEEDSTHIRNMQSNALEAQKQDNSRVHWMAWSLIIGGYILSAFFAYFNKDWLAAIILGTTLGGTIIGFLQNKKQIKA